MKRSYIDGPFGQIHIRCWGSDLSGPPLICLAPSPFSGVAYLTLAPLLAKHRPVIAVDYPGYGNSDSVPHEPAISDYASVISVVANAVSPQAQVDLLGFHTGCLVAAETALSYAESVNRLILIDVPFFDDAKQAELLEKMGQLEPLKPELSMLAKAWDFCLGKKLDYIPLSRAYEIFVDHISAGEQTNAAFGAAFQYPCQQRFSLISHPTWVIATGAAGLYEPSCLTAETIKGASLIEHPEVSVAVLEAGAQTIADTVHAAID